MVTIEDYLLVTNDEGQRYLFARAPFKEILWAEPKYYIYVRALCFSLNVTLARTSSQSGAVASRLDCGRMAAILAI